MRFGRGRTDTSQQLLGTAESAGGFLSVRESKHHLLEGGGKKETEEMEERKG